MQNITHLSRSTAACIAGLLLTLALMIIFSLSLSVIFFTPVTDGNGDYYDFRYGLDINWIGTLLMFISLIPLFYPCLSIFRNMLSPKRRHKVFSLFYTPEHSLKIHIVVFIVLCIALTVLSIYLSGMEAYHIADCYYSGFDSCVDNSLLFALPYLFYIFIIPVLVILNFALDV